MTSPNTMTDDLAARLEAPTDAARDAVVALLRARAALWELDGGLSTRAADMLAAQRDEIARARCPYCLPGIITGLPGNACENCMNTGWVDGVAPNIIGANSMSIASVVSHLRYMARHERKDGSSRDAGVLNRAADALDTQRDEIAYLRAALSSAIGYMMNARIDFETGCTKATAIATITGGLARARAAIAALGDQGEGRTG
jgi:hypothetical protein